MKRNILLSIGGFAILFYLFSLLNADITKVSNLYLMDSAVHPNTALLDSDLVKFYNTINYSVDSINTYLSGGLNAPSFSNTGDLKLIIDSDDNATGTKFVIAHNGDDTLFKLNDDSTYNFYGQGNFSDTLNLSALTASQAVFTDASKNLVSNAITGSGNVVMSTAPTFATSATVDSGFWFGLGASAGQIMFDNQSTDVLYLNNCNINIPDGSITIGDGSTTSTTVMDGAASTLRRIKFKTNGTDRWAIRVDADAESSNDSGSNFDIQRLNDAGAHLDYPLSILRETGDITLTNNLGIGTDPLGTGALYTSVTLGGNSYLTGGTSAQVGNIFYLAQNQHYDTDNSWEYISSDEASRYYQINGTHVFQTAVSGTAGNDVTNNVALTINNNTKVDIADSLSLGGNEYFVYDRDTFTVTTAGINPEVSATANYIVMGDQVTIHWPFIMGTSDANTFTMSSVPAAIRPDNDVAQAVPVVNHVGKNGRMQINSAGVVFLAVDTNGVYGNANWYSSGTKGLGIDSAGTGTLFEVTSTYLINNL